MVRHADGEYSPFSLLLLLLLSLQHDSNADDMFRTWSAQAELLLLLLLLAAELSTVRIGRSRLG